ncbi:MAG: TetR/AcrR family transcriptional regulator [Micropruina sp.]|uniref:TetR/AcrR family transcriptional regulator n=1 Tax=Micropruina sp. TaxID=2737536 RepID=UPI0039E2BC1D
MPAEPATQLASQPAAPAARRTRSAPRSRAELLDVATAEFARLGYFGARVDEIAAKSSTTKRMIYYYFGDKDGLFTAVLERAYADIRAAEKALDLTHLPSREALARLIDHTLRWHDTHPELARLVASENALNATHLRRSSRQAGTNLPILQTLDDILARGRADGSFVREVAAVDLHLYMSAVALFRVTNAPTIQATFGVRMDTPGSLDAAIADLTAMVCAWLRTPDPTE